MPITLTCPKCGQMCQVADQHAGKMVGCPKCQNAIQVPPTAAPVTATPIPAPPIPATPEPVPPATEAPAPGPIGPGLLETLNQSIANFGLDPFTMKLIYAGMGSLLAMVFFTLLPWVTVSVSFSGVGQIPGFSGGEGFSASHSVLGIQTMIGWINILFTLGAAGFMAAVFLVLKNVKFLDGSLWAAAGWGGVASLWRLINVFQWGGYSGIGLYLTLLASLGAAGTFGFVVFQRLTKKKT
jgi:hypothetical protein